MEHTQWMGARGRTALAIVLAALLLAACGGGEEEETADTTEPAGTVSTPPPSSTSAPQISGKPKTQVLVNQAYAFVPTANDADGDTLQFTIANRPAWLTFSSSTGKLSGTPTAANVGTYRGITIQVTDGVTPKTLPSFDIQVLVVGPSSVTLSWMPPTENEDGSALTDLAGYRIRYGDSSGSYSNTISLNTAGLATYVVEGLLPSTYYFVMSAINSRGVESQPSNEAVINLGSS
jgi:hypothetical protein